MTDSRTDHALEQRLGYRFRDSDLLQLALTHRSHSKRNNERLEFLGDAQLNFLIARELYDRFPLATEGELSRLRSHHVNGETLAELAREFELGQCLLLGAGERKSGGAQRNSILANTMEALIGAILIDGGERACGDTVVAWYKVRISGLEPARAPKDPKTRLQELLQGMGRPLPVYDVVAMQGEAHSRKFEVSCEAEGLANASRGSGSSRRAAEQDAAADALRTLGLAADV